MPLTPATTLSTAAMSARSALTKNSSAPRPAGGLTSLRRRGGEVPLSRGRSRVPMSPAAPGMRSVSMSRCRARVAQPGRQLLVALAAAYEVPPHCGARGPHRMRADRLDELVVLLLDAVQVGLALRRRAGRHAHGLARDDEASEIVEEAHELRIVRRLG